MPVLGRKVDRQAKRVNCPWCEHALEVVARSMSIFCPHCNQRVILEDFKIKSYHGVKEFVTLGNVTVERNGTLSAPTRAANLTVKGKVWGNVKVSERVQIKRTGLLRGDVIAPSLSVDEGGVLVGRCVIGADAAHQQSKSKPRTKTNNGAKPKAPRRAKS
jgi:cytoskeletal protein CcmA (bactofilin family)